MTSSARPKTDCGIVRPSALAAFGLTTRSNFVGCSMGSSPGLAPSRILHVHGRAPKHRRVARRVRCETTHLHKFPVRVEPGESPLGGKFDDLLSTRQQSKIRRHHQRLRPRRYHGCQSLLELLTIPHPDELQLEPLEPSSQLSRRPSPCPLPLTGEREKGHLGTAW